eukprot:TRINITY_DN9819_c0_g1_i1.p1 TRINITY_DN9819_c0_g1~~TRINITY_DN9819_c0_g1_i1.p1  ORF type:complete len:245 (+),score=36.32 TRINITY_DN9819_c0_g1_i1:53-787(+)
MTLELRDIITPFVGSTAFDQYIGESQAIITLLKIVILLIFAVVVDVMVARHTKARWFVLHAIFNMIVSISSLSDVYATLSAPASALDEEAYTNWPLYLVISCHIYHMVAFSNLTKDDWVHHIVFVGIISSAGVSGGWGHVTNTYCFFMSGFPGGLDYIMLAAVKQGLMGALTEKDWNARINVWIRGPGCLLSAYALYVSYTYSTSTDWHWTVVLSMIALCAINGQYYMQRVVGNTFRRDKDFQC